MSDGFDGHQWFNTVLRSMLNELLDVLGLCAVLKRLTANAIVAHDLAEDCLSDLFFDIFTERESIRGSPAPKLTLLLIALERLGQYGRRNRPLEDWPAPFDAGDPIGFVDLRWVPAEQRIASIWNSMVEAMGMDARTPLPDEIRTALIRLLRHGLIEPLPDADLTGGVNRDHDVLNSWGGAMDDRDNVGRWEYPGSDRDADTVFDGVFAIARDLRSANRTRAQQARLVLQRMAAKIQDDANRSVFESVTSSGATFDELADPFDATANEIRVRFFEALDALQEMFRDAFQRANFRYELEGMFPELFLDLIQSGQTDPDVDDTRRQEDDQHNRHDGASGDHYEDPESSEHGDIER